MTEPVPAWALEGLVPQQYAIRVDMYLDGEDIEITDEEAFDLSDAFGGDRTLSTSVAGPTPWIEVAVTGTLHECIAQIPDIVAIFQRWQPTARILKVTTTPICMTRMELAEFFAALEGIGVPAELIRQELERLETAEPGSPLPDSFAYLLDQPAAAGG